MTAKVITIPEGGVERPFKTGALLNVKAVGWPSGGGIAFFLFEYTVSKSGSSPSAPDDVTIANLPWEGTFSIKDDIRARDPKTKPKFPGRVVNPVTNDMIAALFQWTPHSGYTHTGTIGGGASSLFLINDSGEFHPAPLTADNYLDPYPATDQCGTPLNYGGAFGGTIFNCNIPFVNEAKANGFTAHPAIYTQNSFSDLATAQYYCDAVNSLNFTISSGITTFPLEVPLGTSPTIHNKAGRYVFALNLKKAQSIAKRLHGTKTETFTFDIQVPACPDGNWTVKGSAFKSRRDFPLNEVNAPVFKFPQATLGRLNNGDSGTVTATVNFKKQSVSFESDI